MKITNSLTPNLINFEATDKKDKQERQTKSKTSNNLLYGTLLALATLNPVSPSAQANTTNINRTTEDIEEVENMTMDFNDKDGFVDMNDFTYSSTEARREAQNFIRGLKPFQNKKWTQALEDMSKTLVQFYNRSNTYAFDLNTDEMVKDKASIRYRKDGRIESIKLSDSVTGELIDKVNYKYDKFGNIDKAERLGGITIEYRADGTRFSYIFDNGKDDIEKYYYNRKGAPVKHQIKKGINYTDIALDGNGNTVTKFVKNGLGSAFYVFNNGELMFETKYNQNDKVVSYKDNYFSGSQNNQIEIVSPYLNKRTVIKHSSEEDMSYRYPSFYRTEPIDGKIVNPVRQGTSGSCHIAGVVNSMVHTSAGRQFLDDMLDNDIYNNRSVVNLYGVKRSYSFDKGFIYRNISRLGRKDGDYPALVKAYESYRLEDLSEEEKSKLPSDFFLEKAKGKMVDSGTPTEIYYAMTGKYMSESGEKITNTDLRLAKACLDSHRGVVNAGTIKGDDKHNEIPQEDVDKGIIYNHNMAVWDIDTQRGYVLLYDSVTEKEIKYPISKFTKYFSKLYYAELP